MQLVSKEAPFVQQALTECPVCAGRRVAPAAGEREGGQAERAERLVLSGASRGPPWGSR